MKKIFFLFAFQVLCIATLFASDSLNIIPQPVKLETGKGHFILPEKLNLVINSNLTEIKEIVAQFSAHIKTATGYDLNVINNGNKKSSGIHLFINDKNDDAIGDEGYHLTVGADGVMLNANKPAGLYYGLKTLIQLLPKEIESNTIIKKGDWKIPGVTITDYPRFKWRGMLFDVSRHFFTKQEVKDFIDNMVKYKYNLLHLHLTDDQGWRIEIDGLPKLTEVGAWRAPRVGKWAAVTKPSPDEPKTYGGFYTHDDIKELVQYAKERFVDIMPEVDVPGHSLAAVASYPELSCTPGTYQVNSGEKFIEWGQGTFRGLVDNTLCPANEYTYTFLDKVFTQVAALFPFEYIHIGGDETYKGYWERSEACQQLMKREKLKNVDELQSYFIKRVQKIVNAKGKQIMGWDEILDGGLAPGATVMSWRGMKGGIAAAKMKHKVVMTPIEFAYYDLMQGDVVAEPHVYSTVRMNKAYQFEPIPPGIDPSYILGGQCNLWSERLTTMRHAEYMLWPRALAMAETLWSPADKKNWVRFTPKVEKHFDRFDIAETKYSRSMFDPIFTSTTTAKEGLQIHLESEIDGLNIHYSFDETLPDHFYPVYTKPLSIPKDASNLRVITYRGKEQVGKLIVMPVAEMQKRAVKK